MYSPSKRTLATVLLLTLLSSAWAFTILGKEKTPKDREFDVSSFVNKLFSNKSLLAKTMIYYPELLSSAQKKRTLHQIIFGVDQTQSKITSRDLKIAEAIIKKEVQKRKRQRKIIKKLSKKEKKVEVVRLEHKKPENAKEVLSKSETSPK